MTPTNPQDETPGGGRGFLLIVAGLAVFSLALTLLIFGDSWFGNDSTDTPLLQSIPAFSGTPESAVAPLESELAELPTAGSVAPDFALLDLDGNTVRLGELRDRPVIINFWASWCAPCRLEMPELEQVQQDLADSGLVVLLINQEESPDRVRAFSDELGLTSPTLLDGEGQVGKAYGAFFLPSTVFVGPDGLVTAVHRGIISRSQIDGYLDSMQVETGG
jgi:cytochrome c biogenesis protein CcmG, thiol:disulfide interchange protein DsbE